MVKNLIILLMVLFFTTALSDRQASAQTIYGVSSIQEVGDSVQLYTATALDGAAYEFYDAAIAGSIYVDTISDASLVAENGDSGGQISETLVVTSSLSDRDYFGFGDHYIVAYLYVPTLGLWYDPYGFSLFSGEYPGDITFFGCTCPVYIPQYVYLFSTLVGLQSKCKNVPMLDGPSSITRFGNTTYSIKNLCRQYTISQWRFDASGDPGGAVIRSDNPTAHNPQPESWMGPIVTAGTVSVKVSQGGTDYFPSCSTQISNRQNFFFDTPDASSTDYPFICGSQTVDLADPPQPGQQLPNLLGYSCVSIRGVFTPDYVRTGPNFNYKYVASVQNNLSYTYTIHKRLLDSQSDFYKAQCGTWNPLTQTGYIRGNVLQDNVIEHESNQIANSHYSQFRYANDDSDINMGASVEKITGAPSENIDSYSSRVLMIFNQHATQINSAANVEPCTGSVSDVTLDNSCMKQGNINFFPYIACPQQ